MDYDGEGESGVEVGAGGGTGRGPPPAWAKCLRPFGPTTLREPAAIPARGCEPEASVVFGGCFPPADLPLDPLLTC